MSKVPRPSSQKFVVSSATADSSLLPMKRYVLLLLALVLLTSAVIGILALRSVGPATPPPAIARAKAVEPLAMNPIKAPPLAVKPANAPEPDDVSTPAESTPLIVDGAKAKERIQLLAATADEAHVAEVARYLKHPSADVRAAARTALVLLDDASAVPFLRLAADEAEKSPETTIEATLLRDAADILAAPRPANEPRPPKISLADGAPTPLRREMPVPTESE